MNNFLQKYMKSISKKSTYGRKRAKRESGLYRYSIDRYNDEVYYENPNEKDRWINR